MWPNSIKETYRIVLVTIMDMLNVWGGRRGARGGRVKPKSASFLVFNSNRDGLKDTLFIFS